MNSLIKAGHPTALKDLISYEEGSIANLDVVHADNMKFVLMAFDEGTGLTPHRAPGNAILTALEGKAIIGYEGRDYELNAGESFRFDKNGLHNVTPQGKFKMSLLLVLEYYLTIKSAAPQKQNPCRPLHLWRTAGILGTYKI